MLRDDPFRCFRYPSSVNAETRFWEKVDIRRPDQCWPWTGGMGGTGYGGFSLDGRGIAAHRAAWFFLTGRRPTDKEHVHHKCGTKYCVNPQHLDLMDASEHLHHHAKTKFRRRACR